MDFNTQDVSLSADSQIFEKLVAAVRQPFVPLYEKYPLHAFPLSAAIFFVLAPREDSHTVDPVW